MPIKNYTPAEALDEQNRVQIALWNGKIFQAGIVDIMEGGEKIHVVRLHSGRVIRREVLKIGYGYGNVRAVSTTDCRNILKGTESDNVLPALGSKKLVKGSKRQYFQHRRDIPRNKSSADFLEFKKQQERFLLEREKELEIMNQKIMRFEKNQRFSKEENQQAFEGVREDLWTLGIPEKSGVSA